MPTMRPTPYKPPEDPIENILPLVDRNQPLGYYNWNMADPDFGPNAWGNVDASSNDFSRYEPSGLDVSTNECGTGNNQSPIDLSHTTEQCIEFHQIRVRVRANLEHNEMNAM